MPVDTVREAARLRYVYEDGFYYNSEPRGEVIPITSKQYYRALGIVEEKGVRLTGFDEPDYESHHLMEGHVISFTVPNPIQLPHATRLLDILSEVPDTAYLKHLVKELDLPLPR